MTDSYAYLEPEEIEADIDRMHRVRSEWEPSIVELMHEGYPHHSEVERELRVQPARWPW